MRKIVKKSLACLLAALLCVTVFAGALSVSAEAPKAEYSSEEVHAKAGEQATVTLKITNFNDVLGAMIKFTLPEVVQSVDSVIYKGTTEEKPLEKYNDEEGNGQYKIDGNKFTFLSLFGFSGELDSATTAVFDINVTIGAEASPGNYPFDETVTMDMAGDEEVLYDVTGSFGDIIVEASEPGPQEPVPADDLAIKGANIALANGFDINFRVEKTMETTNGYNDIYVEFSKPRYDTEVETAEKTTVQASERTEDATNYYYTLKGVQPQEIGTTITAVIYGTKDGVLYKCAKDVTYSVLQFAINQIKKSENDANLKTVCADLIMYGSAVQTYAKYNTEKPISSAADELSPDWQTHASGELVRDLVNSKATTATLDTATAKISSAGLILSSNVIMYFGVTNAQGNAVLADKENYAVQVTYEDAAKRKKSFELEINENNRAELDTLFSTELGTVVTAKVIKKDSRETVSNTITYSIESFLKNNLEGVDQNLNNLCKALAKYGDSVRAYAGLS